MTHGARCSAWGPSLHILLSRFPPKMDRVAGSLYRAQIFDFLDSNRKKPASFAEEKEEGKTALGLDGEKVFSP
jgi:hypothetical protein